MKVMTNWIEDNKVDQELQEQLFKTLDEPIPLGFAETS